MMKLFLLAVFAAVVTQADETASTDEVTVEFIGASGGLKLFPKSDSKSFIMIQQDKLEEVAADGVSKVSGGTSINMAGQNTWTALSTTVDPNDSTKTVYSTTFSKVSGQTHFELSAHLAREDTTAIENVPCNNCTGGTSGGCQQQSDMACAADSGTDNASCATGYDRCTVTVRVVKDELKFSIVVAGFPFNDSNNKLMYALIVKDKQGNKGTMETTDDKKTKKKEVALAGGTIVTPTTAIIKGGADDEVVDVVVTPSVQGSKRVITFVFDSFTTGKSLYYDPDISVQASDAAIGQLQSLSVKVLTLMVAISLSLIA